MTHLTFGDDFNQELKKDDIPESVIYLVFGCTFNQQIKDVIPKYVKYLVFDNIFNQDLSYVDSNDNLEILILHYYNLLETKKESLICQKRLDINFLDFLQKMKGKIIFEELCEKLFNPNRIQRVCDIYKIDFNDYLESI